MPKFKVNDCIVHKEFYCTEPDKFPGCKVLSIDQYNYTLLFQLDSSVHDIPIYHMDNNYVLKPIEPKDVIEKLCRKEVSSDAKI